MILGLALSCFLVLPPAPNPTVVPNVLIVGDSLAAGWGASAMTLALLRGWGQTSSSKASGRSLVPVPRPQLGSTSRRRRAWPQRLGDRRATQDLRSTSRASFLDRCSSGRLIVPYQPGGERAPGWSPYAGALLEGARSDPRVRVVDLRQPFGKPSASWLAPDLVHPNDRGHALIADLVRQAIERTLSDDQLRSRSPSSPDGPRAPRCSHRAYPSPSSSLLAHKDERCVVITCGPASSRDRGARDVCTRGLRQARAKAQRGSLDERP